ncbi:MAG TPA: energy-coupling factor transporter transmembrane component T [Solirubrobacterales bacterium]|nr:energy-coupling factor transporter transmembrane component T [Solirubrobacterales bacterium]
MKPALAYRPGRSPLHRATPGASILYLGSLAAIAFVYPNPVVLVAAGLAAILAGLAAGARRAVVASLRLGLTLFIVMAVVNVLVNHRGDTVVLRGWEMPVLGNTDVTLEALVEGAALGLRVVVAVIVFGVYSACVDPDRVLRALRPVARRSAMSAGLVTRMVPLAVADGARLREAAALRGPAATPVGRGALARRVVESSLDRAVDVAATLELRGHSLPARSRPRREPSRDTLPVAMSGAAILVLSSAAALAGLGEFEAFPGIRIEVGPPTVLLSGAVIALAGVPFGLRRWRGRG